MFLYFIIYKVGLFHYVKLHVHIMSLRVTSHHYSLAMNNTNLATM
jgi:hypothetical protein